MIPWKRNIQLTSSVVEVFNSLRGEAREKAIATGNYDSLIEPSVTIEREPGSDEE